MTMLSESDRPFYTVAEAARLLDVSPTTIWRWVETSQLPAYRVGPRRIRIRKEDLEKAIQPARREVTAMEKEGRTADIFAHYDPVRAHKALRASAGALAHVNRQELLADLRAQREQASSGRPT